MCSPTMYGTPFVMVDFVSTLYRFHEDKVNFREWPVAAYVNRRTRDELVHSAPEYMVRVIDGTLTICDVEIRVDKDIDDNRVYFLVPSGLMLKMLNVSVAPILETKPEYANNDRKKVKAWRP